MPTEKPSVSKAKAPSLLSEQKALLPIDTKAREEEKNFVAKSRRERREEYHKHVAFVILLWLAVGLFGLGLVAKVSQFLLPEAWEWLSEKQRAQLNDFLTTGIISGGVVGILKNKLSKNGVDG
jgi:hypothetical protein